MFYRQTNDSHSVANATENIREAFEDADRFVPTTLFIATWKSVGYFDRNTDQVCIDWHHNLCQPWLRAVSVTDPVQIAFVLEAIYALDERSGNETRLRVPMQLELEVQSYL